MLTQFALFDRLDHEPESGGGLDIHMWQRREIENYICQPATLKAWARATGGAASLGGLFEVAEGDRWEKAMDEEIGRLVPPIALEDSSDPWWSDTKASDQFLIACSRDSSTGWV
ncbi:MAG: hypothetical protein ACR2ML_13145 [Solirubrobacteraceae bacterium]